MNKDQILTGLYKYLIENIPQDAINLIISNDIRVENFFAIHTGVYLNSLVVSGLINEYSLQHTIFLNNSRRTHIDIVFTDKYNVQSYLELKHFSISQNRGQGRQLSFYTSNSAQGKKVGIIGDCEKLNTLRNIGIIDKTINLICCAIVTQKPTLQRIEHMNNCFQNYPELIDWNLVFPVPFENQEPNTGIITLQKNAIR